jgi:hypothetical protein
MKLAIQWDPLKARLIELVATNTPSCKPSFSDTGKVATVGFIVKGAIWVVMLGVNDGAFGPWGWAVASVVMVVQWFYLFVSHAKPGELDAIKAAEHPDPPNDANRNEARAA